jgi:hypothetical protein
MKIKIKTQESPRGKWSYSVYPMDIGTYKGSYNSKEEAIYGAKMWLIDISMKLERYFKGDEE